MSTQAHVQQVASTIAAIKQQGRTAQEADDAVQELQQRVHEARKRQRTGGCGDVDAHGRPLQQSSVAGGGVLDRRGVKALLSELQSATRMQHKAHAKIKQLEGVADRLRAEVGVELGKRGGGVGAHVFCSMVCVERCVFLYQGVFSQVHTTTYKNTTTDNRS